MQERISPPLGAYHVHAFSTLSSQEGWQACGQTWITGADGQPLLLAEVNSGPHDTESVAVDRAYERAYADTLRLILREFVCL